MNVRAYWVRFRPRVSGASLRPSTRLVGRIPSSAQETVDAQESAQQAVDVACEQPDYADYKQKARAKPQNQEVEVMPVHHVLSLRKCSIHPTLSTSIKRIHIALY